MLDNIAKKPTLTQAAPAEDFSLLQGEISMPAAVVASPTKGEEFNLEALRLSPEMQEPLVEKVLSTVATGRPRPDSFFRIHPDANYTITLAILERKKTNGSITYVVAPHIYGELAATEKLILPQLAVLGVHREGDPFVWLIKQGENPWNQSAMVAANAAKTDWIRLISNGAIQKYEVKRALGQLPEPVWPKESFSELLKIAFKDRVISTLDHPVLCELRGE